jgi:hypothetical protein
VTRGSFLLAVAVVAGPCCAQLSRAGDLLDVLDARQLGTARLEPALSGIGPSLADAVASTYPATSASSSVTYRWDPVGDTFVQATGVGGPIFGERAETIGRRLLNLSVSYSYVDLATINGDDLDALENRPTVAGRQVIRVTSPDKPFILQDGRLSTYVPVRVRLDLDIRADVTDLTFTYGVTPSLDVGAVLPIVRSSFRVGVDIETPDPRFPLFGLCPHTTCRTNPRPRQRRAASDSAAGIGDVLLRAKYGFDTRLLGDVADVAAMLTLSLPTGDPRDFQGLGYTRVQPLLIASRVFGTRVESYGNIGIDFNTNDVGASAVRWVAGTNVQILPALTAAVAFLGRHEWSAQSTVALPFFFQIERNDLVDASLGFRVRLGDRGSLAANALVPVTDDGLRAGVIPTVEFEWLL